MKVGCGIDPNTEMGPVINRQAVNKILDLVADAESKGARILCGGTANNHYMAPTILENCHDKMKIFYTEIFGPIIAFYSFDEVEEVINRSNNTEYRLQAYVYTNNRDIASYISKRLDVGIVSISSINSSNYRTTFAGRKASGFWIEGGDEGIFEYLKTKYLNCNFS